MRSTTPASAGTLKPSQSPTTINCPTSVPALDPGGQVGFGPAPIPGVGVSPHGSGSPPSNWSSLTASRSRTASATSPTTRGSGGRDGSAVAEGVAEDAGVACVPLAVVETAGACAWWSPEQATASTIPSVRAVPEPGKPSAAGQSGRFPGPARWSHSLIHHILQTRDAPPKFRARLHSAGSRARRRAVRASPTHRPPLKGPDRPRLADGSGRRAHFGSGHRRSR